MHFIQRRINQKRCLELKNVVYHWRYYKPRLIRIFNAVPIYDNLSKHVPRYSDIEYMNDESGIDDQTSHSKPVSPHHSISDDAIKTLPGDFDDNLDPLLQVRNPVVTKPKGRPPGALNKKRTAHEAEFENSTRRQPSRFEYEEANPSTRGQGRGRPKGRGRRGRGAGRGAGRGDAEGDQEDSESTNIRMPESFLDVFQI